MQATKLKEAGNEAVKEGKYAVACSYYDKGIPYLHFAFPFLNEKHIVESEEGHEEEIKKAAELSHILRTNKALCYLKMQDYHAAITEVGSLYRSHVVHNGAGEAAGQCEGALSPWLGEEQVRNAPWGGGRLGSLLEGESGQ